MLVMEVSLPKPLRRENGIALPGWFHSLPLGNPEDARCGANEVLPSPNGSMRTETRRNVVERGGDDAATDAFVPANSWPSGADGVMVDCWPGANDAVLLWASTLGVSMSTAAEIRC